MSEEQRTSLSPRLSRAWPFVSVAANAAALCEAGGRVPYCLVLQTGQVRERRNQRPAQAAWNPWPQLR